MKKKKRLLDEYRFPGFRPETEVKGLFDDSKAKVIRLKRTQKKRYADIAALFIMPIMTRKSAGLGICPAETREFTWNWRYVVSIAGDVRK